MQDKQEDIFVRRNRARNGLTRHRFTVIHSPFRLPQASLKAQHPQFDTGSSPEYMDCQDCKPDYRMEITHADSRDITLSVGVVRKTQ